jgi:hypothetical protein
MNKSYKIIITLQSGATIEDIMHGYNFQQVLKSIADEYLTDGTFKSITIVHLNVPEKV